MVQPTPGHLAFQVWSKPPDYRAKVTGFPSYRDGLLSTQLLAYYGDSDERATRINQPTSISEPGLSY
jgi:hypothetical protein